MIHHCRTATDLDRTFTRAESMEHFIARRGHQLLDGEHPFRFISYNIPRHVLGSGQFNEEACCAPDKVLQVANETGVRVIVPFIDNWIQIIW